MMGLAWDSLWHAFIAPQQAADQARRISLAECEKLLKEVDVEPDILLPRSESEARYNPSQS